MIKKKPFSIAKAKKILKENHPVIKGQELAVKQRGLLGFIAGSVSPRKLH